MTLTQRLHRLEINASNASGPIIILRKLIAPEPSGPVSLGVHVARTQEGTFYRANGECEEDFFLGLALAFMPLSTTVKGQDYSLTGQVSGLSGSEVTSPSPRPLEPCKRLSPHTAQALKRRREAPGGQRGCG